ncbi:accessory factor UbiK family protein [Fodinicurvata sediminis]|uniref:accessory factor UbiK family protein n=1 Tax=Fodinicurvata sediminis TaxID=1121832 RepID=UPI0003B3CB63|nr:accessory factor UbiK family protein [Fodinicurvata sediminis]
MQSQNRLFDDLARVFGGAAGVASDVRAEAEGRLRAHLEKMLAGMDLVTREEYEVVEAMAAKARAEQEDLAERVAALETRLAKLEKPSSASKTGKKTSTRSASGKSASATSGAAASTSRSRTGAKKDSS